MPPSTNPAEQSAGLAKENNRYHPLVVLAWLMLAYTWILGHSYWFPKPQVPDWLTPIEFMPNGLGLAAFLKISTPHTWCLFQQWIGLPCIFCGMTRSFALLSQGQWAASLHYHLLGIPFYGATWILAVFGLVNPQKTQAILNVLQDKRGLALLLLLLLACWVWKLGQDPVFW